MFLFLIKGQITRLHFFFCKNLLVLCIKTNTGLTHCVETQNCEKGTFQTRGTWMSAASSSHEFEKSLTNFIKISHSNIFLWKWNYHCPWPPYTYQNFKWAKFIFVGNQGCHSPNIPSKSFNRIKWLLKFIRVVNLVWIYYGLVWVP